MLPNVEFRIGLSKTNPGLAKSHPQQKTRGYTKKTAPDNLKPIFFPYYPFFSKILEHPSTWGP